MLPCGKKKKSLTAAYEEFFHHTLPQLVNAEDPDHPYWPSSPSSNSFMVHTNAMHRDTHLCMSGTVYDHSVIFRNDTLVL